MPTPRPVKLSVLRTIGWNKWDPIQLNGSEGGWHTGLLAWFGAPDFWRSQWQEWVETCD